MAIITPTGDPDLLTGKLGGDVLFLWKGKLCRKQGTPPRKIKTESRAFGRHLLSYLSKQWFALSGTQQSCWTEYGSCAEISLPGLFSFIEPNMRLLFSQNPNLVQVNNTRGYTDPPSTPTNVSLSFIPASNAWLFSWSYPLTTDTYIQAWGWKRATFQDSKGSFFTHQATVCAECGQLTIPSGSYQTGTIFEGHIRAINLYGEISDWTTVLTKERS